MQASLHRLAVGVAIAAIACGFARARAQEAQEEAQQEEEAPPTSRGRDYKAESEETYRFCRRFTSTTRDELASLQYLLTPDQRIDLLALHNEGSCLHWIDEFWWNRDPIPTSPENEARAEHVRRVDYAKSHFAIVDWPGWDQRGEIYIRYGPPQARNQETADILQPGTYLRPAEYWYYPALGMTVQFEDAFGNGVYSYFLDHIQLPIYERFSSDRRRMPAGQWGSMPDLDLDLMTLDVVLQTNGGGYFGMYGPAEQFEWDDYQDSLRRFSEVLEGTPVVYPFDLAVMRLPFEFDVAIFRGGESIDRVDVNAEFIPNVDAGPSVGEREYRATAVFFDQEAREVHRVSHTSVVKDPAAAAAQFLSMVMQLPFNLSPAPYQLAITLQEPLTGRFTSVRKAVVCEDFDRRLALSTVCFSSTIQPVAKSTAFTRGNLEVVPRPSARYVVADKVPVYFEVYNLGAGEKGDYGYKVSYRVIPDKPAPVGFWKKVAGFKEESTSAVSSFESAASGPHDVVYIFLNTDQLWPGDFELDVTVVDLATKTETNRRGRFHLVE